MTTTSKVTSSSGNIFKDVELPNAEEQAIKADIVIKLAKLIELKGLTQSEAAALTDIAPPELSKLFRGNFVGFSTDRLVQAIPFARLGVEIGVKRPAPHRRGARASPPKRY